MHIRLLCGTFEFAAHNATSLLRMMQQTAALTCAAWLSAQGLQVASLDSAPATACPNLLTTVGLAGRLSNPSASSHSAPAWPAGRPAGGLGMQTSCAKTSKTGCWLAQNTSLHEPRCWRTLCM